MYFATKVIMWIKRHQNSLMALLLLGLVLLGARLWPHPALSQQASNSTAVYDAKGRLLRLTLSQDQKYRVWTSLESMPSALIDGVLLHEDSWFYYHAGFNPISLLRGGWITYIRGGNRQGGSTITMQLTRLMYRLNTRTPFGKLQQVLHAMQLELCYSKHDILEAYLNFAPYGRNIEGAGAASRVYFDKPVAELSLPEALALVVIPQDPTRRLRSNESLSTGALIQPATESETINRHLSESRNRLYRRWIDTHSADIALAPLFQLPLHLRQPEHLPFYAPHFVEQVLHDAQTENHNPTRLSTTLDLGLQQALERQIQNHVAHHEERGIRNAVAILVDSRDLAVKALVGSADYFNNEIAGQVNGTQAKRSPGSTLKPFIYGLGIDQGVLHPLTVLKDVPTSFGPFTPENFDGRFLGPITATDALIRSRNIPAVSVASKLSQPNFYQFLRDAGISRMASEQFYGLGLVLGGGEVTMQELAQLYAMLANRGVLHTLRTRPDQPRTTGVRLLSEEASFMVLDMLRQNPRPDDALAAQSARLPVYWKTGTSWSFRDAWTAGIVGPYVLVVWIGNFDGSGNPAFIGIEAAAPLFFHIVDALRAQDPQLIEPLRSIPANLKKIEICLASGDLPNAWCPQRATTWFIPGKSPIRVSTVHRPVVLDTRTGKPACPPYDSAHTRVEVYEYWPSDLARVFAHAGIPRRPPPALPDCVNMTIDGQAPQITTPLRGNVYTLRNRHQAEEGIGLNATADADVQALYWFVEDSFIGQSVPGAILFWQPVRSGKFMLRVVDDHGRSAARELRIDSVE